MGKTQNLKEAAIEINELKARQPIYALARLCREVKYESENICANADGAECRLKIGEGWYRATLAPIEPPVKRCATCGQKITEEGQ